MYEVLIAAMKKTRSDVAACRLKCEYRDIESALHKNIPDPFVFESKADCLASTTGKTNSIEGYTCNKVWGGYSLRNQRFQTDIRTCEDALFAWNAIVANVERACFVDLPMYHWRIHKESTIRGLDIVNQTEALSAYELMIQSVEERFPLSLDSLCAGYITWNTTICEKMVVSHSYDELVYNRLRGNIRKYKRLYPASWFCAKDVGQIGSGGLADI